MINKLLWLWKLTKVFTEVLLLCTTSQWNKNGQKTNSSSFCLNGVKNIHSKCYAAK